MKQTMTQESTARVSTRTRIIVLIDAHCNGNQTYDKMTYDNIRM